MDSNDEDRPSIFTRPEGDEDVRAVARPAAVPLPHTGAPVTPPSRLRTPVSHAATRMSRRLVIGLAAAGLLILAVGGYVAGSLLGVGDDARLAAASPSAAPSASASAAGSPSVQPSPTLAPTPTPSPIPTPSPTPAGPPQTVAVDAWATVTVAELNVRSAADLQASSRYRLVRGAVVHVAEGPVGADGLSWYRVASLGGALGWAASGPAAEPFLTTLVDDPTLIRCGEVKRPVFDVADGAPVAHDPIAVGDMALPVSAFSELELGAIELLRGIGGEACFTAQLGSNGTPTVQSQLNVTACGRPVSEGDFFRLRPAAGQYASPENQVKDPAVVHPAVLAGDVSDDAPTRLRDVIALVAGGSGTTGCISLNVHDEANGVDLYRSVDTSGCFIVHEHTVDVIVLSVAEGGDSVRLVMGEGSSQPGQFALGVPIALSVGAAASEYDRNTYVYEGYVSDGCG